MMFHPRHAVVCSTEYPGQRTVYACRDTVKLILVFSVRLWALGFYFLRKGNGKSKLRSKQLQLQSDFLECYRIWRHATCMQHKFKHIPGSTLTNCPSRWHSYPTAKRCRFMQMKNNIVVPNFIDIILESFRSRICAIYLLFRRTI
jgi:hypothetical protein